jgi:peptidoglycan/LPS O-acetylase OafA/YrhL
MKEKIMRKLDDFLGKLLDYYIRLWKRSRLYRFVLRLYGYAVIAVGMFVVAGLDEGFYYYGLRWLFVPTAYVLLGLLVLQVLSMVVDVINFLRLERR